MYARTMGRVLVVDDNLTNCAPLVRLLAHSRVDATWALSGTEALAVLDTFRPDVILLDVMMPGMDGFDVLRQIRADSRFDAVVVVMYTAVFEPDTRTRAVGLGAQGYILKGTPFAEIWDVVRQHMPAG